MDVAGDATADGAEPDDPNRRTGCVLFIEQERSSQLGGELA
jgi:hypothetical protein